MTTRQLVVAAIVALLAIPVAASPQSTCGAPDEYGKALCAYQRRNFAEAEAGFRTIVGRDEKNPQTLHAIYFLARTDMKRGRFEEASSLLRRIYSLDHSFYDSWNCDFLLGECRKAVGKD